MACLMFSFSFGGGGGFFFALVAFDVAVSLSQLVSRIWWCDKLLDNFGVVGLGLYSVVLGDGSCVHG